MKIDLENLTKLTVILEEMCQDLRERLLVVDFDSAEVDGYHEQIMRMSAATKWALNYFDYYQIYKESNPVIMLLEADNLFRKMRSEVANEDDSPESLLDMS